MSAAHPRKVDMADLLSDTEKIDAATIDTGKIDADKIDAENIDANASRTFAGHRLTSGVFVAFIMLFAFVSAFYPDREYSPMENRYLAMKPTLTAGRFLNGEYMRDFEEYRADQFPLRDFWVSFKALCQKLSGQKENNGVYFAADDYLIGKPLAFDTAVTERNLASALALSAKGYDAALMVIPMASDILRDKLPAMAFEPGQAESLDKLRRDAGGMFIDIRPALIAKTIAGEQIFFRTDHHWTVAGAFEAYRAYMDRLGVAPVDREAFTERIVSEDFYGTLWSKNSLPTIPADKIAVYEPVADNGQAYEVEYFDGSSVWKNSSVYHPEFLEQKDKYAYFLGQNRPLVVIRDLSGGNTGLGKLLIFKDSYAHSLAPFLAPHFDEIHLMDLRYYKQDPIAYMEEHDIKRALLLYNADSFGTERSISQIGAYLAARKP